MSEQELHGSAQLSDLENLRIAYSNAWEKAREYCGISQAGEDEIDAAVFRAFKKVAALQKENKELLEITDRLAKAADNVTISTITDFHKNWANKLVESVSDYEQFKKGGG